MAKIGNFGSTITFETSDAKILSFKGFKREVSGRWATHSRIGKKPLKQFLGPDIDTVTFTIVLNAWHGVKPRAMLENIENSINTGKPENLVIGNKKVGSGRMVITKSSETWDEVYNHGELVRVTLDLTLEEYPE